MTEKLLTATIERGMPSDYEIVFERESEQQPVRAAGTNCSVVLPPSFTPVVRCVHVEMVSCLGWFNVQGVTPGNVIFKLKEQPNHPRFRREGNDLHHTMHITLKEALLGFRKSILHLDGRLVRVPRTCAPPRAVLECQRKELMQSGA